MAGKKFAIVGYGGMGGYHADLIGMTDFCEVAGIYDIDEGRRQAGRERGFRVYESPEEIEADGEADGVILATPNDSHAGYAKRFARAGKHIVCEKPAALSPAEFSEMEEAARRADVLLAVHQNRRWDDDFLTVMALREGLIGEVCRIESCVTGSHGIPGDWRKRRDRGGGMMLDWGVHLIDQLLLFDPSPVLRVDCRLSRLAGFEVDDGFDLRLDFESGLEAGIIVETNTFISRPRWRLNGLDGTAVIEDWTMKGEIVRVKERADRFVRGVKAGNGFTRTMASRSDCTVEKLPVRPVHAEPFAFYRSVLEAMEGRPFPIGPEQVLRVLRIMEIAMASTGPVGCRI